MAQHSLPNEIAVSRASTCRGASIASMGRRSGRARKIGGASRAGVTSKARSSGRANIDNRASIAVRCLFCVHSFFFHFEIGVWTICIFSNDFQKL